MGATKLLLLALASSPFALHATELGAGVLSHANPIRKVVNMLVMMQKKVGEEGKKEEQLFNDFMCYCKNNRGTLEKSIEDARTRIPEIESTITEMTSKKAQLEEELKGHKSDRSAAKAAMAEAAALREKEQGRNSQEASESKANIEALTEAIAAITKGMAGSFVQTRAGQRLQRLALQRQTASEADMQELLSFLSGAERTEYAPQSGEIAGILKTMKEEMEKDLAEATSEEEDTAKSHKELVVAKRKEVAALNNLIEDKLTRVGNLGVELQIARNDKEELKDGLSEDTKFAAGLKENCEGKESEWEKRKQMRAEEQVALAETIKVLNDDDALELFKRTLPSASANLMQVEVTSATLRSRALDALGRARRSTRPLPQLDLIALALHGRQKGFEAVVQMIDQLSATLKKEQQEDRDKKEYCSVQLDATEDKSKELQGQINRLTTEMDKAQDEIVALSEEIETLTAGVKALDASVAEATEERKAENAESTELIASNSAAKQLLQIAQNRLNKFYNKALYRAPPKRELSEGDQIASNFGISDTTPPPGGIAGTGVTALVQVQAHARRAGSLQPQEPFEGSYRGKEEESQGVSAMIKLLISDLDKEMVEARTSEKNAQAAYVAMTADAQQKRAQDASSISKKEEAKADMEAALDEMKSNKEAKKKESTATLQYLMSLHSDCDWLLKYYDTRETARADELDSLQKAKAVLSGADYSLVQISASTKPQHRFLSHA